MQIHRQQRRRWTGMMSPHRKAIGLVVGVLVALAANLADAQQYPDDPTVFPPGDVRDLQFFAPPDTGFYDGLPAPNRGFNFAFDGLYWSIQKPDLANIGASPSLITNQATYPPALVSQSDTTGLQSEFSEGNRFEIGYQGAHNGLMVTYYRLNDQLQLADMTHATLVLQDSTGAMVPKEYTAFQTSNEVEHWNIELLYTRRFRQFALGGQLEAFVGVRYLQFDETFDMIGYVRPGAPVNVDKQDMFINQYVNNHLIGPEIGGRYSRKQERWGFSADCRFVPGFNFQTFRQQGEVDKFFVTLPGNTLAFTHSASETEFAPLIELRLELHYQLTRAIQAKVGWNGIWMDNIARASSSIDYVPRAMGIDTSRNRQDVLMTGVTAGIEINR